MTTVPVTAARAVGDRVSAACQTRRVRGHTLLEPLIIVVVGAVAFFVGRAVDSVVVTVCGVIVALFGIVISAFVGRTIGRQHKAWSQPPRPPSTPSVEPPS